MRIVLEQNQNRTIYLFTTQGHTYVGVIDSLQEDVVALIAPDGRTRMHVNLADISGIRPYDEESEEAP